MPPKYSPGQPITITEPFSLSIIEPNNMEAPIDIVVRALCPVR